MFLYPAIDLLEGRCVRLYQGDFTTPTKYPNSAVEIAQLWESQGVRRLHLVDLDGAKLGKPQNMDILEEIRTNTRLEIDFGGGLKTKDDVLYAFECGASKVNLGSMAVHQPAIFEDLLENYPERIILSLDLQQDKVMIRGWQEQSELKADELLARFPALRYFACTDVTKDGTLEGPNLELYRKLVKQFPELKCISSGGVSKLDDLKSLREINLYGAIVGRALLEEKFTIAEAIQVCEGQ